MRIVFSWKVTLLSCCLPLAPSVASSPLFHLLEDRSGLVPTAGLPCLCCTTSWRLSVRWKSLYPAVASRTDTTVHQTGRQSVNIPCLESDRGGSLHKSLNICCIVWSNICYWECLLIVQVSSSGNLTVTYTPTGNSLPQVIVRTISTDLCHKGTWNLYFWIVFFFSSSSSSSSSIPLGSPYIDFFFSLSSKFKQPP